MWRPFYAVALNYWWHTWTKWCNPLVVLFLVIFVFIGGNREFGPFLAPIYGPGLVAYMLREQVIHVKMRLLPNAMWPHLLPALGLFVIMAAIPTVVNLLACGIWSWSLFGFLLCAAALMLFAVMRQTLWITWLFFAGMLLNRNPTVKEAIHLIYDDGSPALACLLLVAGIASLIAVFWWIIHLSEEDPSFRHNFFEFFKAGAAERSLGGDDVEAKREFWSRFNKSTGEPSATEIAYWSQLAGGGLWQRAQLWTARRAIPKQSVYLGYAFSMVLSLFWLFVLKWYSPDSSASVALVFLAVTGIAPILIAAQVLLQQRSILAMEILRPNDRSRFVQAIGISLVQQALAIWVMSAVFWCVAVALFRIPIHWPQVPTFVCVMLGLVAIGLSCTFWLLRTNSSAVLLGMLIMFIVLGGIGAIFVNLNGPLTLIACAICLLTMLSVAARIAYDAYRRWMETEFG